MLKMQIVVMPEISRTISLLRADISELRRNWKWVTSPTSSNRSESFQTIPLILQRFQFLCTMGRTVTLTDSVNILIGAKELLKFQSMLANLGAHTQAAQYFNLSLQAPKDIPRGDVKLIFEACCGGSMDNASSMLDSAEEIEKGIRKVLTL